MLINDQTETSKELRCHKNEIKDMEMKLMRLFKSNVTSYNKGGQIVCDIADISLQDRRGERLFFK